MANELEIRKTQKEFLHDLLLIKHENKGTVNKMLDIAISKTEGGMLKEDISHIYQIV